MIVLLILGAILLLFATAALAPLESLSWWAGWGGKPPEKRVLSEDELAQEATVEDADFYLVYLSGIGAISGTSIPDEEHPFLEGLAKKLPGGKVITDIYPYSVTNKGLTSNRLFSGVWRSIEKMRLKNPNSLLAMIVNVRNVYQLFVSADRRYGPIYNLGIANEIHHGLLRNGYRPESGRPIVVLGWSGGGQIAIGSVTYLAPLPGPIYVISVGGMLSDDIGFDRVDHLWHLYGTADPLQALGGVLFAGRWPILPKSPWNNAMANGKIDIMCLGPYAHNGKGNYFDMETKLPNDKRGRTYGEKSLDTIAYILTQQDILKEPVKLSSVGEPAPSVHAIDPPPMLVANATAPRPSQAEEPAVSATEPKTSE